MTNPKNPYNQAIADCTNIARRRLDAIHAEILDNIENGGELKEFMKLCGQRDALSDLLQQSTNLIQPE